LEYELNPVWCRDRLPTPCGLEPFRRILTDPRFANRPMLIETEKTQRSSRPGEIALDPLDVRNLETLRKLRNGVGSHF